VVEADAGKRGALTPLAVVSVAVAMQVAAAVVLKGLADRPGLPLAALAAGIGLAAGINGLRFLVWGYAHRRYPLSVSYPLSSLFFPLMLGVAWLYGDPVSARQAAGCLLITCGVLWLAFRRGA
jgi:drug/metabolite transporter (DMT)-like permease